MLFHWDLHYQPGIDLNIWCCNQPNWWLNLIQASMSGSTTVAFKETHVIFAGILVDIGRMQTSISGN